MDFSNFKEFHCSICDKLFDGVERSPKMLSCGHSFCLSCLNKIFPHSPNCPTCKADIQFSSVELIPVNLLIQSCVSKINVKSGVKRKVIIELKEAENHSSTEVEPKRKKIASVGFCKEHENFNQLRCMNCETWICSMCATLNHKKCDTLLIEDAFKEIQKQNTQIISDQRDIRKSKLAMVFKYLKAIEEKKKLLELDIENLKLQIEAKLKDINKQNIEFDKLQTIITDEKKICVKLNEIQLLTNSSLCIEKLLEAKKELEDLIPLSKNDQELARYVAEKEEVSEKEDKHLVLNNKGSTVGNGGPIGGPIGGPGLPPGGGRNDGIMEVLFCVPANRCGIVIGKGGETIKQINKQTGANCSLDRRPDANPNPSEKTFILRGTPNQLENAKKLISEKAGIKYRRSGVGPGQGGNGGTGSRPGQNSPSNLAPQVGANSNQQFNQALHPIGPSPGQGGNGGTGSSGNKPGQNSPSNLAPQVGANSYQQLNQALHPIAPSSLGIIESNSGLSTTFQISPNSLRSKLGMASLALKTHSKSLNSSMLLEENLSSTLHNKNNMANSGEVTFNQKILMAGDSRLEPLRNLPCESLKLHSIDFIIVNGIQIKELIEKVDEELSPDHATLILMAFLGDSTSLANHQLTESSSVSLMSCQLGQPVTEILELAAVAQSRWQMSRVDRKIIWTLPYYLDIVTYNNFQLQAPLSPELKEQSISASLKFVHFVTQLQSKWFELMPKDALFRNLNEVLFHGRRGRDALGIFKSMKHLVFPQGLLLDGLHPSPILTNMIWKGLVRAIKSCRRDHQAVAGNGVTNPISQLVVPGNVVTNPISQLEVPGNVETNPKSQLVVPGKVVLKPISQLVVPDLTTSVSLGGARTGPILIIGDSRVGELMKYPKQVFESNVEFYWEERLQVAKMIKAVDEMRREDHSAIILVGLLADFTEIKMVTSSNGQLIEKLVCEAGEAEIMDVMEQVIEASRRWEREHIGQVIVWTIPYFVDFSRFNFLKIGEENVIEESKKYTSNLIKIFIILRDTWKNLLVGIPYSDLNDALFHHCSAKSKLWKTILSTQVMPEKHPFLMLTTNDGIHPTERLVNHMWTKFSKYVDLRSRYLEKLD